ncbi:MAG: hypothetical protein KF784_03905 [Fimbriimonadaceae bacterium]|nr:hypothetical protein [Fimbriimonadaceae bacterium]
MNIQAWYARPFVAEITEIFGYPKPPDVVTEEQVDGCQRKLEILSSKPWHEIERSDYWYCLMDWAHAPLQRELFDYLCPGILIHWRDFTFNAESWPAGEIDIYRAMYRGEVLWRMMDQNRREAVLDWMHDGFIEGVDNWSGKLEWTQHGGRDTCHFFLWTFHALGQCSLITARIWETLSNVKTSGRAQFWIVLATGIAYPINSAPFVVHTSSNRIGTGVVLNQSESEIHDAGLIAENVDYLQERLTLDFLAERLKDSLATDLYAFEKEIVHQIMSQLSMGRGYAQAKLDWYLSTLRKPYLDDLEGFPGDAL